jgi:hypothetical protein
MSTCNRLDLQTLGSQPIMPKNLPDHCSQFSSTFLLLQRVKGGFHHESTNVKHTQRPGPRGDDEGSRWEAAAWREAAITNITHGSSRSLHRAETQ